MFDMEIWFISLMNFDEFCFKKGAYYLLGATIEGVGCR